MGVGESFRCPRCGKEPWSAWDLELGWCAVCKDFTRDSRERTQSIIAGIVRNPDVQASAQRRLDRSLAADRKGFEFPGDIRTHPLEDCPACTELGDWATCEDSIEWLSAHRAQAEAAGL